MTPDRETLRIIGSWMEDGRTRLPDHVLDAVLDQLPATPQHRPRWPVRRIPAVNAVAKFAIGAAAVVAVAVAGFNVLGLDAGQSGGVGAQPIASPTAVATATPTVAPPATPQPNPDGRLQPGTYVTRPLAPDDSLTLTYTVPAGWTALGEVGLIPSGAPGTGSPGGIAFQFMDVTTLNGDPCKWKGTDDDVAVGPGVDDLVAALLAQTDYEVSEPVDVTIGGYSGSRVDIVMPTEPFTNLEATAPTCDEERYRVWSWTFGDSPVYAQGPANRWQANIVDVEGTRLVIVAEDFPGTSPEDRARLDAVLDSIVIEP